MDFFDHQEEALQSSRRLVFLFVFAVVALIVGMYGLLLPLVGSGELTFSLLDELADLPHNDLDRLSSGFRYLNLELLSGVTVFTLTVVGLGSLYKTAVLRSGGSAVAEALGGRQVHRGSGEPRFQALINIVEEMAIASGVPVPAVYILEGETGINAFAAGWSIDDAAVAVTDGALDELSRDQLQGVIAHEFSHVLNGDMRLNIRLMGVLHGILLLALIGRLILRGSSRIRGKNAAQAMAVGMTAGIILVVAGYAGWFLGQLIKAGVSRQREFLADASAVQFTRNPDGIAGALKQIGLFAGGTQVQHPKAEEASHMMFGNPLSSGFWSSMLATHPPLTERISRLDPSFEAPEGGDEAFRSQAQDDGVMGFASGSDAPPPAGPSPVPLPMTGASCVGLSPEKVFASLGTVDPEHVSVGRALIDSVPPSVESALNQPMGAVCILFGLLLDPVPEEAEKQRMLVYGNEEGGLWDDILAVGKELRLLPPSLRLPVADLAMPMIRTLPEPTIGRIQSGIVGMIEADHKVELFEFALFRLFNRRLEAAQGNATPAKARFRKLGQVVDDVATLLSILARVGHNEDSEVQRAFDTGVHALLSGDRLELKLESDCHFGKLTEALNRLALASPAIKREVMSASIHCVLADHEVTLGEAELLRVVSADLGCPLPVLSP